MADLSEFLTPSATVDEDDQDGADALKTLRAAWINEKCAPELLRYEEEAVNSLNTLVHQQEADAKEGAHLNVQNKFHFNIYSMEIERIKYLLANYLRTRLWKVEAQARYLMSQRDEDPVDNVFYQLAASEQAFCQQYYHLIQEHAERAFLSQLGENFAKVPDAAAAPPNLNAHVFCKFSQAMDQLDLAEDDEEEMVINNLEVDDIYILRYKAIRQLLQDGRVHLL
eukprot:m.14827 g.14827  ORF g.14827 m.14827 type:complete len:225 (+) comp10354_c0_seq2:119-793(+)